MPEEGEWEEMLIIPDSILVASKQNLVKRKFLYINRFNHEVITMISLI